MTVHEELCKRGVHRDDSARLVTKLSTGSKVLGPDDVAELLADGSLGEARRLLDSLPDPSDDERTGRQRLAERVAAAEAKKERGLARYHAALEAGDHPAAAAALREALDTDPRDADLHERLRRLPPPPPANLSLRVEGRGITVAWNADGDDAVTHAVVRTAGTVPANPRDGRLLVEGHTATLFRDEEPPVGARVRYSVFATRDGSAWSDPATGTCVVLPPPADLGASAGATEVSLSWGTPPEAVGAVVTRTAPDGSRTTHRPTEQGELTVTGLTTGTKYRFSVAAVYLSEDGQRQESAAVSTDATPRGAVRAVVDLRIEPAPDGHRVSWTTVADHPVELWTLPVTARVEPGTRLSRADLARMRGSRLTLRPGPAAPGRTVRDFDTLSGVGLLVPLTVEGDGGLVGTPQITGSAPQVRMPTVERLGEELRLSWRWPEGDHLIEVGWQADGRPVTRRITRTAYNDGGGVKIPRADKVSALTLATVVRAADREWVSAPVEVPLSGRAPAATYTLRVRRSWLSGKGTATVTVESPEFRGQVRVLTVLKEAGFMPGDAADGTVVDRRELDFAHERSHTFELRLGKVATPFWVRLFTEPGSAVRLEDPPTSRMRG
ncbi:fibronectin type III domain-containing protein [Nocardiopsis salina]|uniref:fibronectin type III domain-containing protein n=1 Tax=Nocardiopsis salina TaxID=245836 RepID=UPI00034A1F4D|nr:fibronectin type III domain-containing protein [Nocardiopsis salina]